MVNNSQNNKFDFESNDYDVIVSAIIDLDVRLSALEEVLQNENVNS